MLTFDASLAASRHQAAFGEGKHYFAGRPHAGRRTGPARSQSEPEGYWFGKNWVRSPAVTLDAEGRVRTLDIRTGEYRWIRLMSLYEG